MKYGTTFAMRVAARGPHGQGHSIRYKYTRVERRNDAPADDTYVGKIANAVPVEVLALLLLAPQARALPLVVHRHSHAELRGYGAEYI